jgi:hypothetical protein
LAAGDKRGMSAAYTYDCFNFRLRSELPLAELGAEAQAGDRPLVDVRLGSVPATLPGAEPPAWGLQAAGDSALLTVTGIARFLVRGGREIVIDPLPGGSDRNVRLFLLGSALGLICHQRGLLPLHANAIVAGDGAYAFAGHSGAGKSTLAAHFARAGYEILCDDVCVISFDDDGTPLAWPGLPRLKLWGDAADAFGHDRSALDRAVEGMDKYYVPMSPSGEPRPVPLRRLYLLAKAEEGAETSFERLSGHAAMEAALGQTYRANYLRPLGLAAQNFRQCAALVAHTEVYEVRRAWGFEVFEKEAGLLEDHVLGPAAIATGKPVL